MQTKVRPAPAERTFDAQKPFEAPQAAVARFSKDPHTNRRMLVPRMHRSTKPALGLVPSAEARQPGVLHVNFVYLVWEKVYASCRKIVSHKVGSAYSVCEK